ncbi:transcription factor bHLH113 [Cocos nucifera]|nr:transcription factor bHLH113 [Cocos nucifera]
MEEIRGEEMEEGNLIEMLGSGEEEGYLFGPPSSLSSPSSCYSSSTTAYMLYFGGREEEAIPLHGIAQKSSDSSLSSLSSSPPSTTTTATVTSPKSSRKKVEAGRGGAGRRTTAASNNTTHTSVTSKKPKTEDCSSHGSIKVRKEKIGERIIALQQLVSPFGKSDTASVLHEALGYIRFLHDQVQVLSSPYLQRLPSSAHLHEEREVETRTNDLRSRGLCLVPVSCTEHVANSNGADLWSPAMGSTNSSSSSTKH